MEQLIKQAQQKVERDAGQAFTEKINKVDGFIPRYYGRPEITLGMPWRVRVQLKHAGSISPLSRKEIGIGVVVSVNKITDNCWIIYTDTTGDHRIDHSYIVEM